ncbi:MAG TPA: hypothetical protein VG294_12525 [Solirubrobacteraceae bacterium]|jgi:hypothetical protein|nr:hypothetical protein [Solirubrobacteraceae bacterium]
MLPGPKPRCTPLTAITRGLAAGAVGTAAMDLLWFYRYKKGGGEDGFLAWEFSSGLSSWDEAPAPAQVGRRLFEGIFQREIPAEKAGLVNNITHWGYGMLGALQYGIVAGSLKSPKVVYGLPFGATVWGSGYVVLPLAHLYKPIWQYDAQTLAKDLSAHLVYGLTTAAAFDALSRL